MAMQPDCKKALQGALRDLTENLQVEPALIHLQSKQCIGPHVVDEIQTEPTEIRKRTKFVEKLQTCGQKAYDVFRSYLDTAPGQQYLGEILDSQNKKPDPWSFFEQQFRNIECDHNSITNFPELPEKLHLLLIGKTGSGKSATGNTILSERSFETSSSSQSCTKCNAQKVCRIGEKEIQIIDTPGLFDTGMELNNENLLFSVVNSVISFQTGIHVFLLIMNFTKFTNEEEQTLDAIEKMLTNKIYRHCVIILTHSKDRFAAKDSRSLRKFIEEEKTLDGTFPKLLKKVNYRVIAVENSFDDALLQEKHREHLLSCLAQVVASNKGNLYSNQLFVSAQQKFKKETEDRRKRYKEEEDNFEIAYNLEMFLLTSVIPKLSSQNLKELKQYFTINSRQILKDAKLPTQYKKSENFERVFDKFPESYQSFINLLITCNDELNGLKGIENKLKEDNEKVLSDLNLKFKVLSFVGPFVADMKKEDLQELLNKKKVPDSLTKKARDSSRFFQMDEKTVRTVIEAEMFGESGLIQSTIDGKSTSNVNLIGELSRLGLQQDQIIINQSFFNRLPSILRQLYDNNHEVFNGIVEQNQDIELPRHVIEQILQEFQPNDDNSEGNEDLLRSCIAKCAKFLREYHAMLKEETSSFEKLNKKSERLKNTKEATRKIGDIIDKNLKEYLAKKSLQELQEIDELIANEKVPGDITQLVMKNLFFTVLDEDKVEREILVQLQEKREITNVLIQQSSQCFPGSSLVFNKHGKPQLISSLKIGEEVLVYNCKGELSHDKVFLFSHSNFENDFLYICIRTEHGRKLLISPEHILPINDITNNVPAMKVSVGDTLFCVLKNRLEHEKITSVCFEMCKGAFSPMTTSGSIVVNGVAASCYTTFFNQNVAQALLLPIRSMFRVLPQSIFHTLLPYDHEEGMPFILAKCRSGIIIFRTLKEKFRRIINSYFHE